MHKVLTNIFLLQKVIDCFEERQGSGILLDKDRFLLLQSSIVDKALMCPNSNFEQLEQSIQNSGKLNFLFFLVRKRVAFISARLRGRHVWSIVFMASWVFLDFFVLFWSNLIVYVSQYWKHKIICKIFLTIFFHHALCIWGQIITINKKDFTDVCLLFASLFCYKER